MPIMLHLISPAKTLDFTTAPVTKRATEPRFLEHSQQLITQLRDLSPDDVASLMHISQKLGELNHARFHDWHLPFTPDNAKQAILAFKGDVYTGMNAETFSEDDFSEAQQHLRILSGLYGLLRPLDLIQAYRLEMGTGFANTGGKNLYEFWGETLTQALNKDLATHAHKTVINLASNEYWSAIKPKQVNGEIITPVFKDTKNGKQKIISFFAKKARGMMSAFIIQNRIHEPDAIKEFNLAGYSFDTKQSTANNWVFTRPEIN